MSLASNLLQSKEMILWTNWGNSGLVYQAFYFSIQRQMMII